MVLLAIAVGVVSTIAFFVFHLWKYQKMIDEKLNKKIKKASSASGFHCELSQGNIRVSTNTEEIIYFRVDDDKVSLVRFEEVKSVETNAWSSSSSSTISYYLKLTMANEDTIKLQFDELDELIVWYNLFKHKIKF